MTARGMHDVLLVVVGMLAIGCSDRQIELVSDPLVDASSDAGRKDAAARDAMLPPSDARVDASDAQTRPADAQADAASIHEPSAHCGDRPCACDDGVDNDQDSLSDGLDPECTGAFDDDEKSFGIGKPNKQGQCRDCFWDDNAGSGDDGCRYPQECLAGTAPNGNGNCSSCEVAQKCLDSCRSRTPNGCDCFGCCEVQRGGDPLFVELSETCDLAHVDDSSLCPRCTPSISCLNECGRCELCLGKAPADLPADCTASLPNTPNYTCEDNLKVCTTSFDCIGASYCLLGCCLIDLF